MYEQIDGILTCRDLVPAGCADFRRPWVPRQGRTNRTLALSGTPCTSTWALQADLWSPETSKRPPGSILEHFWVPPGGPGGPKTL